MTSYITIAIGAVFLTVIVGMIIPEGKLSKSVNFVLRIACIFILISPVFSIFDLDVEIGDGDSLIDYEYVCDVYSESQSSQLEELIAENLGVECVCEIEIIYKDGAFVENGVTIYTNNVENEVIESILSYLKELGYININIDEETD